MVDLRQRRRDRRGSPAHALVFALAMQATVRPCPTLEVEDVLDFGDGAVPGERVAPDVGAVGVAYTISRGIRT